MDNCNRGDRKHTPICLSSGSEHTARAVAVPFCGAPYGRALPSDLQRDIDTDKNILRLLGRVLVLAALAHLDRIGTCILRSAQPTSVRLQQSYIRLHRLHFSSGRVGQSLSSTPTVGRSSSLDCSHMWQAKPSHRCQLDDAREPRR